VASPGEATPRQVTAKAIRDFSYCKEGLMIVTP
jgi:hypothetical protein